MTRRTVLHASRTGLERDAVEATLKSYRALHDDAGESRRKQGYATMVNQYYDLVTDFYEYGWGESFHFAARHAGESFRESLLRHEHTLALRMGLEPGMEVLDLGCGVGGPMRNIARFAGVRVTGVNNNRYQIERAKEHTRKARLDHACSFVEADFMSLPMPAKSVDAAYAIEATCHAPDRTGVFSEALRVLRPGGVFAGYEWCLTDRYEPENAEHRRLKSAIEEGNGLPALTPAKAIDDALRAAGFEVVETRDVAPTCSPETPWHLPLSEGEWTLRGFARTRVGRLVTQAAVRTLETFRVAPRGAAELSAMLDATADALVGGGRTGIFTPMYFFLARKPGRRSRR